MLALSPIECVVTALTYNRSLALYDRSLHQCLLYDDINETEMSDGMGVLFIQDGELISSLCRQKCGGDVDWDGGIFNDGGEVEIIVPRSCGADKRRVSRLRACRPNRLDSQPRLKGGTRKPLVLYDVANMKTCGDLDPARKSGVYRIAPIPGNSFDVYCDVDSEGGPWTVIQNRQSKEVDFYRNWDQYKDGFGDLLGNFWLGNDHIHTLTATPCILRVQVETVRGAFWYVEYSTFQISSEAEGYKLSLSGFSRNVIFEVAFAFTTIHKLLEVKTIDYGTLQNSDDLSMMAISPIECSVTALTYNRSLALYDRSLHQCLMYDDINQTEISDGMGVLYIQDMQTCGDLDPTMKSGVYRITPIQGNTFDVYCDMDSEGGPWTVIQNRQSKEVDFYRNWDQYKNGFGDLLGNFWLGNERIHTLTKTPCIFRLEMESLNGTVGYAEYTSFQISSEVEGYKLSVDGYRGNIR
ncbi:uncharacterized protein LOC117315879 [Pecten maximus]|uniref:uncharacterized protein LOC117315879 n=1 Tax=Pecten maximus TaxID=6579 RepID=UPI00145851EA|nr:uncharacterized protein LOC117315879 [Pecten maximus]